MRSISPDEWRRVRRVVVIVLALWLVWFLANTVLGTTTHHAVGH